MLDGLEVNFNGVGLSVGVCFGVVFLATGLSFTDPYDGFRGCNKYIFYCVNITKLKIVIKERIYYNSVL